MVAQLSTSGRNRQLKLRRCRHRMRFFTGVFALAMLLSPLTSAQSPSWQQPHELEIRINPLSTIDRHYMAEQRAAVEALANRLGTRISGHPERDLQTLQTLLDRQWVPRDDIETQQAMGMVLGDLLAKTLDMDWVVYRDRAGRSRALNYRNTDVIVFPVTMIAKRYSVGAPISVQALYDKVLAETGPRLPGARWRQP